MASVKEILTKHLEAIKSRIQQEMASQKRNASGRTSSSLTVNVSGEKGVLMGSSAVEFVERGRGAGRVPKDFISIIKDWIKAKGISVTPIQSRRESSISPEERGLNSLAGAIAYTIMKKGTKLHRSNGYNDILTSAINEELEVMSQELAIGVVDSVERINQSLS